MRLVHLSDLHLGFRQFQRSTPGGINQREADVAKSFTNALDKIITLRPDVVLIAGDVFHTVRPTNPAILHAFTQFSRLMRELPEAKVVIAAGNHDLPRMIHYATDPPLFGSVWDAGKGSAWNNPPGIVQEEAAYERLVVAMAVLMTNRGVPMIYYGDEVGLPGAGDPDNRRPMQWSGWTDPQKNLLDQMRKLGKIRKEHKALRLGTRTTEWVGADAWVYRMVSGDETVYVALNRSDAVVEASGLPATGTWQDALTAESVAGPTAALAPRSVRILTSKP